MVIEPLSLKSDYWQNFVVNNSDLNFLYNYLLEVEQPQPPQELIRALVTERIRKEKETLQEQQQSGGAVYFPKDHYQVGQTIRIPSMKWQTALVADVRPGNNPDLPPFEVITVEMPTGEKYQLASGLSDHKLNQPITISSEDLMLDVEYVLDHYGEDLDACLTEELESNPDLVRIAGKWFPRALLVDINIGHLNLAEAVLDMMGGGPLPTSELMEQIDIPSDADANLREFSLNLALQEDNRFDEVGPSGEILWHLQRLEPEEVRNVPSFLRFSGNQISDPEISTMLQQFEPQILDELEPDLNPALETTSSVTVALTYPHWRVGSLPLTGGISSILPTALETPRVQFTFVDGNTGEKFPGWVVRQHRYVFGLREWYLTQGLITGGIVHIQPGGKPGEINIRAEKKRGSREWIRTLVIGSDGGMVYSMLRHNLNAAVDERMAMMVTDVDALDKLWERTHKQRPSWEQTIRQVMTEMVKLSPQNHVHVQELYAGVNVIRRCPPSLILSTLMNSGLAYHMGNLYFRLDDPSRGDNE